MTSTLDQELALVVQIAGIDVAHWRGTSDNWQILSDNWVAWVELAVVIPVFQWGNMVEFFWSFHPQSGRFITSVNPQDTQRYTITRDACESIPPHLLENWSWSDPYLLRLTVDHVRRTHTRPYTSPVCSSS